MTLQKLDEAKKALQTALELDPNSAQAWYNLGLAQHAGNELEAALDSFQHAVKLDPRDVDSWYFVGVCYGEMKQFDKAIETFKQDAGSQSAACLGGISAGARAAALRATRRKRKSTSRCSST